MKFFTPGRVEHAAVKTLPYVFDPEWIITDHHLRTLLDHVFGTAFTNSNNAAACLYLNNTTSLVE